jgi:hypothetical protein
MKVKRISPFSGITHTMDLDVTVNQLISWERGELIHNVFHHLTPDEREFIKTGITPDEWDTMFGG